MYVYKRLSLYSKINSFCGVFCYGERQSLFILIPSSPVDKRKFTFFFEIFFHFFFEILNQYAISSSDKFSSLAVSSAFLSQLQPCLFHGKLTRPTFCGLLKMPNNTKFSCYILYTLLCCSYTYSSKDYKNQRMDTQTNQHYRHVF